MGAGRSGSTLLGIMLGSLSRVFYAGELFAWNHFRGRPLRGSDDLFDFWAAIQDRVPDAARHFDMDFYRRLEHMTSLLRVRSRLDRKLGDAYEQQNRALFCAVAGLADADVVVDSSHFPLRASRLRRAGIEVHLIHLRRDPRRVVNALQKPEQRRTPMHPLAANIYCWAVATLSAAVYLQFPRSHRTSVRYEDLIAAPERETRRLAAFLDVPCDLPDFGDLTPGLIFQGNRMRLAASVGIQRPKRERLLRRSWEVITSLLQAPLVLAHGYRFERRYWRSGSS